jgi:hypothetical protein
MGDVVKFERKPAKSAYSFDDELDAKINQMLCDDMTALKGDFDARMNELAAANKRVARSVLAFKKKK